MADETIYAVQKSNEGLRIAVSSRLHEWVGDEHASGELPNPAGPDPFAQLLGSLASCMGMTVRMYVDRKGWPVDEIRLELVGEREPAQPLSAVRVQLSIVGDVDGAQRERILSISQRCPVHRTLAPAVEITTELT